MPILALILSNVCIYKYLYSIRFSHTCPIVRRVHWLRARTQLMRWREQVTLTTYEMQWTVAYFRHISKKWVLMSGSQQNAGNAGAGLNLEFGGTIISGTGQNDVSAGTGPSEYPGHTGFGMNYSAGTGQCPQSAGEISYARRKHDIWEEITKKADIIFRSDNSAYVSPL